jgi:arylformamidase
MKVIDLSQTLENGMAVYPGAPAPSFEKVGDLNAGDVYSLTKIQMTTHVGTHLDCNSHVNKNGYFADNQDLSFFMGKGIAIDCSQYGEGDEIGLDVMKQYDLIDKEFVLFFTNWARFWGQENFWGNYPCLSDELVEFFANHKTVRGLGFEYAAIDSIADTALPKHKIFLGQEKCIIENLTNINTLLGKEFTFIALPLKLKNGDGSPVRPVAILQGE